MEGSFAEVLWEDLFSKSVPICNNEGSAIGEPMDDGFVFWCREDFVQNLRKSFGEVLHTSNNIVAFWLMVAAVEFLVIFESKEAASSITSPEPSLSPGTPPSVVELESLST